MWGRMILESAERQQRAESLIVSSVNNIQIEPIYVYQIEERHLPYGQILNEEKYDLAE